MLFRSGIIYGTSLVIAIKIEKIKKAHNIHTWKEIVAFDNGQPLDEIEKLQEKAKRPYQKVLLIIGSASIAFIICLLSGFVFFH